MFKRKESLNFYALLIQQAQVIRDAVQLPGCRAEAFSKYVLCRAYG